MSSSTAASGDFPIYPSERPSVADAKVWRLGSFDVMPSDWKALTAGIPPHSLVHLIDCIVPPPLPEDAVGPPSIIVAMSLTRGMAIMDANQKNAVILATRNSGMDGIRNSFFDALRRSLRPNEPLLLAALESAHLPIECLLEDPGEPCGISCLLVDRSERLFLPERNLRVLLSDA